MDGSTHEREYMTFRKLLPVLLGALIVLKASAALSTPPPQSQTLESRLTRTNNIGVALMEQLKFEEAAQQFQKLVSLNPRFIPGHVNLGIAKFYQQEYEEAAHSFQEALQIDSDQIQSLYMTGLIHRNQADTAGALRSFQRVVDIDPDDPSANYFLGLLYRREREFEKSTSHLRKTIESQPYNASARYNLAIALQKSGQRDAGMAEMLEFQRLQGQFGTHTIGLQYLEQGRYSLVIDQLDPYLKADDREETSVAISFSEVSSELGMPPSARLQAGTKPVIEPGSLMPRQALEQLGSGVSFGDFDGDGWFDLFVSSSSFEGTGSRLFRNVEGRFVDVTSTAGLDGLTAVMSGIWGDYNNDEQLDLYLVRLGPNRLYMSDGDGTFTDRTTEAGVGDAGGGSSATAVDYDHDGDLDIYVANLLAPAAGKATTASFRATGHPNVLYRNNGDGTFSDVSEAAGVTGGISSTTAVVAFDFNNSRDVDLLAMNSDTPPSLFSNLRNGTFQALTLPTQWPLPTLAVGDLNRDGRMDLIAGLAGGASNATLFLTGSGNSFQTDSARTLFPQEMRLIALQTLDADNDGDLDLAAVAERRSTNSVETSIHFFQNRQGRLVETAGSSFKDHRNLEVRGLSLVDFDNDGDLDFAVAVNQGMPLLFRNDSVTRNNWLQVQLAGTNSNRLGLGTKVEVLAGRLWQKAEAMGGHGGMSQNPPLIHFGLGSNRADTVRLLWPGGVLQSEIDPPVNKRFRVQELDRKGTSCPILYVWDGTDYRFQTDFLGGSAFGTLLAPATYDYPDTDEYIKLSRQAVALKNGQLGITLNNQLEEIIFFDKLELVAVDHPAEFEVYPDEKLLPGPPYDSHRLLTFQAPRLPISARDGKGRSVLRAISYIDRVYAALFEPRPFKGYANLHEFVLDLGNTEDERVLLLMHAWIDYADSTSNLAASQSGLALVPPYLQVQDKSGQWVTVLSRMGFPAGLPKPMTVDLTGKFLSPSRKVKIVTNMRIHWDQILVESSPARTDFRTARLAPSVADLQFRGFPEFSSPDGRLPKTYDYSNRSQVAQWKTHVGAYTRYGDVRPLLAQIDDFFVITRSGDEIEAWFDVGSLPSLPAGWTRDYLVFVDGFGKDMDVNSAASDYVGPLPFHGMSSFPYPAEQEYPNSDRYRDYMKTWNTRLVEEWIPPLRSR